MSYKPEITARKGVKEGTYALGSGGLVVVGMGAARSAGYLPWSEDMDPQVTAIGIAILVSLVKMIRNWIKERRRQRRKERSRKNLDGFNQGL